MLFFLGGIKVKHKYTKDDISDLKKSIACLRGVQMNIENNAGQYARLDNILGLIEDIISEVEDGE